MLSYHSGQAASWQEEELLRIFRTLTEEQRTVCVEQCRVFVRMNQQKLQGKSSYWSSGETGGSNKRKR